MSTIKDGSEISVIYSVDSFVYGFRLKCLFRNLGHTCCAQKPK